jgi:hypothetical protein
MRPTFALASSFLTLAACGSFSMSFTNSGLPHRPMEEHRAEDVQMFVSGPPKRPYVEAGLLEARGGASDRPDTVLAKMRIRAGQLGCDGLVIIDTSSPKAFRAACIVYEPAAKPAASSSTPTAAPAVGDETKT